MPPREPGPWDVAAAEVTAAAREAGAAKSSALADWKTSAGHYLRFGAAGSSSAEGGQTIVEQVAEYLFDLFDVSATATTRIYSTRGLLNNLRLTNERALQHPGELHGRVPSPRRV